MQSCVSNFKRWKWKFKEVIFPKAIEPGCVKNEETGCFCRNRGGLDGEKFGGSRVSGRSGMPTWPPTRNLGVDVGSFASVRIEIPCPT